jgi:hypothetical protein
MAEVLTDPQSQQPSVASPEQNGVSENTLSYRERLRQGVGAVADHSLSFIDLTAGIALARDDLRLTRNAMNHLDTPYDGMLERQAATDTVSMGLESDIILDFRRDAQRIGFTDTDAMPAEHRAAAAQSAVNGQVAAVAAELAAHHPEWTQEEVDEAAATRARDFVRLLSMNEEERNDYLAAQLEYHELKSAVPEIQSELSELRAERNQRLSRLGGAALRGVVNFVGRVRNLPNALSARAMVAGMSVGDRIRSMNPENRRRAFWGTAAGIAITGIASYIAYRAGHAPSGNAQHYTLASSSSPLLPTEHLGVSGNAPTNHLGTPATLPVGRVGETSPNFVIPTSHVGTPNSLPTNTLGVEAHLPGNHLGTPDPANTLPTNHLGTAANLPTTHLGSPENLPTNHVGSSAQLPGNHIGQPSVEGLSGAKTSTELFNGNGAVDKWPKSITVNHWNSQTLDGSLTGISRQMLIRSGVSHPDQSQINALVDSLRPQAQPNGYLLYGQKLDLRPALNILPAVIKK